MSTPYKFSDVWETMKNVTWYKWTTFWNHGGDVVSWIDDTNPKNLLRCKGLARREDGLIFQNSKECHACSQDHTDRYSQRAIQDGYFLRGTDIFGTSYDETGRHLPSKSTDEQC